MAKTGKFPCYESLFHQLDSSLDQLQQKLDCNFAQLDCSAALSFEELDCIVAQLLQHLDRIVAQLFLELDCIVVQLFEEADCNFDQQNYWTQMLTGLVCEEVYLYILGLRNRLNVCNVNIEQGYYQNKIKAYIIYNLNF